MRAPQRGAENFLQRRYLHAQVARSKNHGLVKVLHFVARSKCATPMQLSRHTPRAGVQKPLMANIGRVHSTCARHSPRALRNKGSVLRSSADESGCLLPGNK
jgi:hypothetical protein